MFISETTSFTQENSFTCSFHPLLQFGTVAQKKVGEIEKNYKINQDLNLGDSITENLLRFSITNFLYS
jgi:hypothetical protein